MTVLITLTTAGTDSGPFDLYSNLDGYVSAFATGVSKSALLAGYSSAAVPDFTTTIRVKSNGDCVNYIDIVLTGLTTTTTTTASVTCAEFELAGGLEGRTFNFTNCDGNPQSVTIPAGDSAPFCIRLPYFAPGATNIGACGGTTTTTTTSSTTAPTTGNITISNNNPEGFDQAITEVYVNSILVDLDPGLSFPVFANETKTGTYVHNSSSTQTIQVFANNVSSCPLTVSTTIPIQCEMTSGNTTFTGLDLSTGPSINLDLGSEGEACD